MPRVKECDRQRAKRPKTRSGCKTCKSVFVLELRNSLHAASCASKVADECISDIVRRTKCDETKPHCFRCTSTGRCCDGYEIERTDSKRRKKQSSPSDISPVIRSSATLITSCVYSPSPLDVFDSWEELRAFAFFQDRTAVQLAGYYDCGFWSRVVLQAAHVDTGVRHALISLAAIHENYEVTGELEHTRHAFPLKHYHLAIQAHLGKLADPNSLTMTLQTRYDSIDRANRLLSYLASCMIFYCIEMLQSHYVSALALVQGAVKLFYGVAVPSTSKSDPAFVSTSWPMHELEALLGRMQSQALGLIGPEMLGATIPPQLQSSSHHSIPTAFASLAEARESLEYHIHQHSLTRQPHQPFPSWNVDAARAEAYVTNLQAWSAALDAFTTTLNPCVPLSIRDQQALTLLTIRRSMLACPTDLVRKHGPVAWDDQMRWDEYQDVHATVIRLAESVAKGQPTIFSHSTSRRHIFTLDFGIVSPLFEAARICRDPVLRRKAIALLRAYPAREGLWDGLLAARVAERQVEIEEGAVTQLGGVVETAKDVPRWARVSRIDPIFVPGTRKAVVTFAKDSWRSTGEQWDEVLEY